MKVNFNMQTDKFFSLVKQLIGKELVTEIDSPSDFSMGNTGSASGNMSSGVSSIDTASAGTGTSSTSSTASTTTTDTSNSDNSNNDNMDDFSDFSGETGGGKLSPTYDVNVDMNDQPEEGEQPVMDEPAPRYKILDVLFDPDDDLNTKVKIQNIDTGETEVVNLSEVNI